ncbi:MAG: class I SAM-dependent methyltransferase [Spirochaetia bacterium]|jgi:cyclopropane-fatty-acyl-phospholipid synthase
MASRQEMEYTYSLMDQIFRLSIGERGDFSGAMYDGDFSLSLEEAQDRKHRFIADMLNVGKGTRILDMGCGWGPLLAFFEELGAKAKGLTLSSAQAASCRRAGFDVEIMDCRAIRPETFGQFDAITSVGAFEHFCSVEEWQQGKQDAIYGSFFRTVADLLPVGGRLFLQTMVFGRNMIDYPRIDIHAERGSTPYVLAVMRRQFPGSWLPFGSEQIERNARPWFRTVFKGSGRLDYMETIRQWGTRYRRFSPKKYAFYLSLVPRYLARRDLRQRLSRDQLRSNILCFEREVLDHFRMVLEKTQ